MLVLFTPAGAEGYFKELGEPAIGEFSAIPPPPPTGPPDVGRIMAVAGKVGTEILPPPIVAVFPLRLPRMNLLGNRVNRGQSEAGPYYSLCRV
jgi:hypothetical protein